MIRHLSIILFSAFALTAETPKKPAVKATATSKTAKKTEKAKAAPAVITVPAGAQETEPGVWLHTDAQGKRCMYRQTPFGIVRLEDKPAAPDPKAIEQEVAQLEATTAVEEGDSIRFTRPGPFGFYRWTTKKSELNEQEQAIWKRERERSGQTETKKPE
jgi:hypothetical protein